MRGHWHPKYPGDGVGLLGRDGPVTDLIKHLPNVSKYIFI